MFQDFPEPMASALVLTLEERDRMKEYRCHGVSGEVFQGPLVLGEGLETHCIHVSQHTLVQSCLSCEHRCFIQDQSSGDSSSVIQKSNKTSSLGHLCLGASGTFCLAHLCFPFLETAVYLQEILNSSS